MLAHLFRPCVALRRRAKEGLRSLLDVQTGMLVVHKAYPRELAPRALGGGHRFQHGVVRVTWVLDVHFISSLPVMQRPACTAWADKRHVQIV